MQEPNSRFSASQQPGRRRARLLTIFGAAACLLVAGQLRAQGKPKTPTVNAGVGSCSADFVVQNGEHKPLYNAKIEITFRYGFLNLHKVSLEAFTDSNGRARFEGLPNQSKKPLVFEIHYGDRQKSLTDDPLATCKADYSVVLP
jgi:hypothetical protein